MYILVVEDDPLTSALVQFALNKEGYEVETVDNSRGAMQVIQKREPDLLLLDITMPYQNGFDFSKQLYNDGYATPIIFMTAKDSIEDKLQGFRIGADDYICKPFNYQELVMRVNAVMRRIKKYEKMGNHNIRVGQVELLPTEMQVVMPNRKTVQLTRTEMRVLRLLMLSPGQVIHRDHILSEVWRDDESTSNSVDVYIHRLRIKLETDPDHPEYIISVRGSGYKFVGK